MNKNLRMSGCKRPLSSWKNLPIKAREDENIFSRVKPESGDYAWRIVVGQPEVNAIMATLASSIDYSNFKNRVHDLPDQAGKLPAYSQRWSRMLVYQSAKSSSER